jgi:hypothetical protein
MTFRYPFKLAAFKDEILAGTYVVEFEQHGVYLQGRLIENPPRCRFPAPAEMLSGNMLGALVPVEASEL